MKLFTVFAFMALYCMNAFSQTEPAKELKSPTNANPLFPFLYTADPTAVEYEGRLYVYSTNDTEEFIARGKKGDNTYSAIGTLVVMSSDDLINWTYHGLIPAKELSGSWCGNSWAPSIVSRTEDDGLTHFYLYFSNGGGGVGVLTSTSPIGPWKSPTKKALVNHQSPGVGNCSAPMDPGAVIDANGIGWLAFGGGGSSSGNDYFPGNARIVKLKSNMIELDGNAVEIPAPYHFEANELNYMNGKWVYTYCSLWGNRDEWSKCGTSIKASSLCSMDYMVSDNPLEPSSWKYRGEYFANPGSFGYPWYNNHTHLHKFNDKYYLLYHTNWLESVSDYSTGGFRCVAINEANVREKAQYISPVTANNKGVNKLKNMNPYIKQQAETMATGAGLEYENFFNATNTRTRLSHLNLAVGNIPAGAWTMVRNVDFGEDSPKSFNARLKGRGTLEVRLDDINSSSIVCIDFSSAGWKDVEAEVSSLFNGIHDVYFYFPVTRVAQFDEWYFEKDLADGIESPTIRTDNTSLSDIYELNGRKVQHIGNNKVYIMRSDDGKISKVLIP